MAVLLNKGYAGLASGNTVQLPTNTESSLVSQGLASTALATALTTGALTCNLLSGRVAVAAGASSLVVTNANVDANSKVVAYVNQAAADGTFLRVERIVPAAGSFTIYGTAAATATTFVDWAIVVPAGLSVVNP
jgi:hypothetical protein